MGGLCENSSEKLAIAFRVYYGCAIPGKFFASKGSWASNVFELQAY
jgi:hypothetical protein